MFYLIPVLLVLGYAVYSWYWQATISIYAKYRVSSLIWSLLLLTFAFNSGMVNKGDLFIQIFLAGFILMSIVDGFGGISTDRIIISGYFKRSVKYSELAKITLIPVPRAKKPSVMAIFTTLKNQSYYLRFSKTIEELIPLLNDQTTDQVEIEIQNLV